MISYKTRADFKILLKLQKTRKEEIKFLFFQLQTAILLTFNMIAIMIIYPAMIALDLRRRRANRRDLGCCLGSSVDAKKVSVLFLREKNKVQFNEGLL